MPLRLLVTAFLSCFVIGISGCRFDGAPRPRLGCYPSSTGGTKFLESGHLGPHRYNFSLTEKNGIVYTCNAGHVDITHLRIAADWTAYLTVKSYNCLMRNKPGFTFGLNADRSKYFIRIAYPEYWMRLPEEDKVEIAREASISLGQYLAFTATTWHEIMTWFGYKCIAFLPEYPSAFSWEDSFSNLLGTYIAAQALHDNRRKFDEAMTLAIDHELESLGIQSQSTAKEASDSVRGKWFSGYALFLVSMKKRNFDIGLDNGYITPSIVPSISQCRNAVPKPYPAPTLDYLSQNGFSVKVEIEPREFEKGKVLNIAYSNAEAKGKRIDPTIHLAQIMNYIKKEAAEKYGEDLILTN
ncbi:MAG: hypothetical protein A2167_07290 [Planctomycetes bacterium RBG_13_46_10]|nr:MAG: hypothetical protein A2167_07290 [Planctomycetes bacterium RBG_13_46_10]